MKKDFISKKFSGNVGDAEWWKKIWDEDDEIDGQEDVNTGYDTLETLDTLELDYSLNTPLGELRVYFVQKDDEGQDTIRKILESRGESDSNFGYQYEIEVANNKKYSQGGEFVGAHRIATLNEKLVGICFLKDGKNRWLNIYGEYSGVDTIGLPCVVPYGTTLDEVIEMFNLKNTLLLTVDVFKNLYNHVKDEVCTLHPQCVMIPFDENTKSISTKHISVANFFDGELTHVNINTNDESYVYISSVWIGGKNVKERKSLARKVFDDDGHVVMSRVIV